MGGNRTSGREDLDKPFQKRRRNLGRANADGPTRADWVALQLAEANTLRELSRVALRLGAPPRYIEKILERDYRNSVKVMLIHQAARHFYEKARAQKEEKQRTTYSSRVGRPTARGDTEGRAGRTQYGIPTTPHIRRSRT